MTHQLFPEVPATALGEQRVFRMQLHARDVTFFFRAVRADSHFARSDSFDTAVIVVKDLRGGESGVNFNAHALGLFGQPAADVTH